LKDPDVLIKKELTSSVRVVAK